jgi:pilus assembly protein CpaF
MFAITVTEKGGEQRRLDFEKSEITIGRVQGNDVILPKGNVSKRHARIVLKDGKFIIVDLKSTNGTYVNGRKITSPLVVKETDKIYIGDFILGVEEAGAGSRTAEAAPMGQQTGQPLHDSGDNRPMPAPASLNELPPIGGPTQPLMGPPPMGGPMNSPIAPPPMAPRDPGPGPMPPLGGPPMSPPMGGPPLGSTLGGQPPMGASQPSMPLAPLQPSGLGHG